MPFNGLGQFTPLSSPTYPAVANQVIYAANFNAVINDIIAGLGQCITKDGQSTPLVNLPMAGFKLTGLGAGAASGEALTYGQANASLASLNVTTTLTAPTATPGDSTTKAATTNFVQQAISLVALGTLSPTLLSLNSGPLAGFRNVVINGCMRVFQRTTPLASFTNGHDPAYGGADRMTTALTGFTSLGLCTASRSGSAGGGITATGYYQQVSITSGVTIGAGSIYVGTRIEAKDAARLSGKTVTVSATVRQTSLGTGTAVIARLLKATATDNFTGRAQIGANAPAVTPISAVPTPLSNSWTLGSLDGNNGIEVQFWVSVPAGTITSGDFSIGDIQLEVGTVATPLEIRPIALEEALCRRYYYRITGDQFVFGSAHSYSTNVIARVITPFPVPMRVAPTALEQAGTAGYYAVQFAGVATSCTAVPTFVSTSPYSATSAFTALGHTAGQAGIGYSQSASAYLGWSAEL